MCLGCFLDPAESGDGWKTSQGADFSCLDSDPLVIKIFYLQGTKEKIACKHHLK